jgi:hypothetical protein
MRTIILGLLLAASQAWGSITYIAGASASSTTTPAINTTGANLLIIVVTVDNSASLPGTIFDAVGGHTNTYTLAKSITAAGSSAGTYTYYCLNPAYVGSGHTFTISIANGYPSIYAAAYSGVASSSALDAVTNSAAITTGTSLQPGTITPSCTNELVVAGLFAENGTATVSGATLRQARATISGWWGGAYADSIQTSKAAINPAWSFTSGHAAATIVAFKAADSDCSAIARHRHKVTGGE